MNMPAFRFMRTGRNSARSSPGARLFGLSTKGSRFYTEVTFEDGDFLVFGPETRGLPDTIRAEIGQEGVITHPHVARKPQPESLQCGGYSGV